MRLNTFLAVLCCVAAGMISFAVHTYSGKQSLVLGVGSLLCIAVSLIAGVAVTFENAKTSMLARTASWVVILLQITAQFAFSAVGNVEVATYLLVSGLLMITHMGIVYQISRTRV
jgi:hypothetical protein